MADRGTIPNLEGQLLLNSDGDLKCLFMTLFLRGMSNAERQSGVPPRFNCSILKCTRKYVSHQQIEDLRPKL
jgi:hypothetical protein